MKKTKLTPAEKDLTRRYLLWCYKTTRENLDRIDRYFTQLPVDHFVLADLSRSPAVKDKRLGAEYLRKINEFQKYIEEKAERVFPQKYADLQEKNLQPDYWYLKSRLAAVEKAVVNFLGAAELKKIKALYEQEMTRRILEAREHS